MCDLNNCCVYSGYFTTLPWRLPREFTLCLTNPGVKTAHLISHDWIVCFGWLHVTVKWTYSTLNQLEKIYSYIEFIKTAKAAYMHCIDDRTAIKKVETT